MKIYTAPGETYIVTSSSGCDVTTDTGVLIKTCAVGQDYFTAMTDATMLSDDAATVTVATGEVLAMLGGGSGGGEGESYTLTAEDVQAVVPIAWKSYGVKPVVNDGYGIALGNSATAYGIAIGYQADSFGWDGVSLGRETSAGRNGVSVGREAETQHEGVSVGYKAISVGVSISVGNQTQTLKSRALTLGAAFTETVDGTTVARTCTTEGTGSITIGAGANTLNTIAEDGVITESSNSVTIGCKASTSSYDSVVIGAGASSKNLASIIIGAGASSSSNHNNGYTSNIVIGTKARCSSGMDNIVIGYNAASTGIANNLAIGTGVVMTGHSGTAIGYYSKCSSYGGMAVGNQANVTARYGLALGMQATASAFQTAAIGNQVTSTAEKAITIGAKFDETVDEVTTTYPCTTEGTGSITIGAGAVTKNTTTTGSDGTETTVESSNAITIGHKASNTTPDTIVIGAGAKSGQYGGDVIIGTAASVGDLPGNGTSRVAIGKAARAEYNSTVIGGDALGSGFYTVAIGNQAKIGGSRCVGIGGATYTHMHESIAVGYKTDARWGSIAIGAYASAKSSDEIKGSNLVIGTYATAAETAKYAIGIGHNVKIADNGAVAFRSTAEDGTITQLYFSGANTPLATTYEGGEAMMGYVVQQKDSDGNYQTVAAGTNKLSALFPNNSNFAPTTTGLDDEEGTTPMIFHPSDLDLPQEEEPAEPETEETYTPIPVYPTVEPEVDIPEPTEEEYTPLPVYPIVEPEIDDTNP